MFLENEFARPLFDFVKGGPPKAFQCLVLITIPNLFGLHPCGKVTRTERGMRMHLKQVHNWKEQPFLYSTESQSEQNLGAPRKLRAGKPQLKSSDENQNTETINHRDSQKAQGELLLNLTREEK